MSTWLLFLLLGLGAGAIYAALAMGVILVYRGSGVVNFALGAMAMYPAMVFVELRLEGDLVFPWIVLPNRIGLGDSVAFVPAAVLALVVAAMIGALAYGLVFRPIRHAAPLTRVIASIGLTIVLQGLAVKNFGVGTRRAPQIFPTNLVDVFGRPVPVDRFWLTGIVILLAVGLTLLYRYSRFGLATRAAASNEKGALLLGYSTVRLGLANWLLAAVLAGGLGVLVSPLSGVNPFNYSLFVVPALAAALAGRLVSFPIAAAVGLGIGMFEALTVHIVSQRQVPNFLLGGFDALVPLTVIVLALVIAGRRLPGRDAIADDRQISTPTPNLRPALVVPVLACAAVVMVIGDSSLRLAAIESMFIVTLMLSLVVLTGYVGQVSLAQLAFAGFSAFMLSRYSMQLGIPFPWSPLLAIGTTTALGTVLGVPALRIRGIQFAIVTLAAAVTIEQLLFRSPSFVGFGGLASVEQPELFGVEFGIIGPGEFPYRPFGYFVLGVTVVCALVVANIRRGPLGQRFLAVKLNERAAAASGINVARTKLLGAAVASTLAGVAGMLFAYKNVDFSGVGLEAEEGLQILALAYLGGIGSVSGAVIGGLLAPAGFALVALGLAESSTNQFLLSGLALVIVAIRFPGGIASAGPWLRRRLLADFRPGGAGRRALEHVLGIEPDTSVRHDLDDHPAR